MKHKVYKVPEGGFMAMTKKGGKLRAKAVIKVGKNIKKYLS